MYKKTIKRGDNKYSYYYTNIRKDGKVKNIFLSSDKKEALKMETKLKNGNLKSPLNAYQPEKRFGGANALIFFLGVLIVSGIFFYLFNGITGYSVANQNVINLEIGENVGLNSTVFLTYGLNEYSKPLNDFNLEAVDGTYYIDSLNVDVNDFNINFSSGNNTIFLSLVDNGELVAIKSHEFTTADEEPEITVVHNESEGNVTNENIEDVNETIIIVNDTLQNNITLHEETSVFPDKIENTTFKERIVVGKPVKWLKTIKFNQTSNNVTLDIPKEATNISVSKIEGNSRKEINYNKIIIHDNEELREAGNLITGNSILYNFGKWLEGITGFAVLEESQNITLQIDEVVEKVEIEYITPGPYSVEIDIENGKQVTIGSGVEGYTDILAFTTIRRNDCSNVVVYWVNENRNVEHDCSVNNNELYVEWNVEHLSDQSFLILIGEPFSSQNITGAGVYVNTQSHYDYRIYTVARTNDTLYCNNLTTLIPTLSYEWYKNDVALGSNASSLSSNNFMKGDYIYCQINGINSTNRNILDTTLGDFSNGTFSSNGTQLELNATRQSGNLTLNNISDVNGYFSKGNFTSSIFDLGLAPNMSLISWGQYIPKTSYYYQDNLVFGWDGSNLKDYVNTSNTFSAEGGLVAGNNQSIFPDNNATTFNAHLSQRLVMTDPDYLDMGTSSFSISFWYKPDSLPFSSGLEQQFITKISGVSGYAYSFHKTGNNNITRFTLRGGGDVDLRTNVPNYPFVKDNWYFFTTTIDRNPTLDNITMYVNGEYYYSETSDKIAGNSTDSTADFRIGGSATVFLNGTIDEAHIWKRALSSGEVNSLYNISKIKYPISFQTRMGNNLTDQTNWGDFVNSTGGNGYYLNSTGEQINYTYNGSARYIQYRALFETLNLNVTPVLNDVVMKQVDYKTRIFNTAPFSNFSLLYPANNTWLNDNTTQFNITNITDYDGFSDLDWNLEIYNSTTLNSTYLVQSFYNLSLDNYTLNDIQQLADGNYSWRARLNDSRNRYDDVYENYLSDWNSTFEFYIDTSAPNITLYNVTANRTTGQVIINQSNPITYGENLTLRFNLTDLGIGQISAAWIKIWDAVKNGALLFFGYLTQVAGDWWEITIPQLNETYGIGQINYTIYANDTLNNNTAEYDNNFYVETGYPFNVSLILPANGTFSTNRTPEFNWTEAVDYSGLRNYTVQVDNDVAFGSFDRTYNTDNSSSQYQVLGGEQLGSDSIYYWRVYYCDSLSYCNTSEVFTYTVDNINPIVNLNSPASNTWSQAASNTFTYTPTDTNLDSCLLYWGNYPYYDDATLILDMDSNFTIDTNRTEDLSKSNNNVYCVNMTVCPEFNSTGKLEGGFEFDDVDDQFNLGTINTHVQSTWSVWLKTPHISVEDSDKRAILGGNNVLGQYVLRIISAEGNTTNIASFSGYDTGLNFFIVNSTTNIADDQWHMITTTRDSGTFKLYVDGVLEGTNISSATGDIDRADFFPLTLGHDNWVSNTYLNGTLDEIRIWNATLTANDISLMYNASYNYHLNDTDITVVSGTQNTFTENMQDQNYVWNVICNDTAGNNGTSTVKRILNVDLNNPQVNLTVSPTPLEFGIQNTTVNFTILDTFLNYSVMNVTYPNNTYLINSTSNFTIYSSNLTVLGNYTVIVYGNDRSGRENMTYGNITVSDTIQPLILINYPENNSVINLNSVNFSFNASDLHSIRSINITINGTFNSSISILFNNISLINYINVTGLGDQQDILWNISVYDNSSNVNISETRTISIDSQSPAISNVNRTPEPSYPTDDVLINATVIDTFLQEIWIEGNWSGDYINYTNSSSAFTINSTTNTYTYNITNGNFSNQQSIIYRWWANDSGGNLINTSWYEFKVQNRLPTVAVWRYPPQNQHMLNNNFTIFEWDNSTDQDLDNVSYELEVYNNTAFNSTYLIFAFNDSISNYTLLADSMPSVGDYYARYRSNDSIGYNNYNYTNFTIAYATLNIVSPTNDQILRKQNIYFFNITELGNGSWVNNVSIYLSGATFNMYVNLTNQSSQYAYTSYGANVTIPDVVSQYVTIYAYSWNGSIGSSTNNTDVGVFRITIPNVLSTTTPLVNYFCPDKTYNTAEQVNITVKSQMSSVLINVVNVSVVTPGGETVILNQTASDLMNYINRNYAFEHNFTYTPESEGEYQLKVEVTDLNGPENGIMTNSTSFFKVTNKTDLSFTSNGISNFTVLDLCSNKVITNSNASLSINEVPGQYNLQFVQGGITTLVSNATIDGNEGEICVYNDLADTITTPDDTRAVDQFNLSCYNLDYGWSNATLDAVNITYNYTSLLGRITHESNLGAYKCYSSGSCSWSLLNSTVTPDSNKIDFATNNFSVFMVSEDVTVTTVTVTTAGSGGGGGGGGGGGSKSYYDLDILETGTLTIGDEREIDTVVIVKNPGQQSLFGISLSANSDEEGLEFNFDNNYIYELLPGAQVPVTLNVKKTGTISQATFDVNIVANVASPSFIDQSKISVTSLGAGPRSDARKQLEFLDRLFVQNPACKELYELVKKAKASFENEDYEASLKLAEGAVNACENLLTGLGLKIQKPKSKVLSDNMILGIEIAAFIFMFYGIYYYYRRRRFKKKNI